MTYDRWQKRLSGEKIETYETEFDFGFYRQPIKENKKIVGWRPVAFFEDDLSPRNVVCLVGDMIVTDKDAMSQVWLSCVRWPLSEENYRQAVDHGTWFDADPTVTAERAIREALDTADGNLAAQIAEAKKGVPRYLKIEDDETAAKAQDLRSHLTDLAGKLDKERKAQVQPHLDAQREVNAKFNPIIEDAKAEAAKIRNALTVWEKLKRDTAEFSNVPAPKSQIRGATGRTAAVVDAFDAVITDISAYFETVKERPEVVELLQRLAQRDINAGLRPAGVEAKATVRIK